jgi:hypothetical protein
MLFKHRTRQLKQLLTIGQLPEHPRERQQAARWGRRKVKTGYASDCW